MAVQVVPVGCVYPYAFIPSVCGQRTCGDGSVALGIPGVPPIGPSIVGQFIVGDGHEVGGTPSTQFGSPVVYNVINQTRAVGSVSGAGAFGAVTIKTAIAKPSGGVSSAQVFGALTITTVVRLALGGVPSAQAFGAPTIKTAASRAVKVFDLTKTR